MIYKQIHIRRVGTVVGTMMHDQITKMMIWW